MNENTQLIELTQLPVIVERLETISPLIDQRVIVGALLSGSALAALISGIFGLINRKLDNKAQQIAELKGEVSTLKDTLDVIQRGQVATLHDRIKYLGNCYIKDRAIDSGDLEDLIRMHAAYHDLGGNGYLDDLMAKVKALPPK